MGGWMGGWVGDSVLSWTTFKDISFFNYKLNSFQLPGSDKTLYIFKGQSGISIYFDDYSMYEIYMRWNDS